MSTDLPVPETRVLAIASHVVYGYVGNTMAAFVMQSCGCEVAALNTVQFSNHTGYKQFKGTKASAQEIRDIYQGLKQSYLTDFDVMLSGYAPSAEAVDAVGAIGRDLKLTSMEKPGSFFWVLDPVMGDEGRLYVNEDVVPAYKNLLRDADLIVPNQFEAELLSEVKITSFSTLVEAVTKLHNTHHIPHIIVTSVSFDAASPTLSVVGSTARADGSPRLFKIDIPAIDCFFSGTGDMFAALAVVRLREAVTDANLNNTTSWLSPDDVNAVDLPLAKAAEKVLASMHAVLEKTKKARDEALKAMEGLVGTLEKEKGSENRMHLLKTKAAEVRLVRNMEDLRQPKVQYHAQPLET
ncbi:MAG: putative pyridoxal kinase [Pleopsidium flavum]|nr:MAG: putative pyridoxal kinase [Pleopsidium flavum]